MNDDSTFWDNFGSNLKIAIRQASSYVIIAAGIALQALVGDPMVSAKVAEFLGHVGVGWAAPYTGIIVVVLGAIAKAWPQVSVTKAVLAEAPPAMITAQAVKNADDAQDAKDAAKQP